MDPPFKLMLPAKQAFDLFITATHHGLPFNTCPRRNRRPEAFEA